MLFNTFLFYNMMKKSYICRCGCTQMRLRDTDTMRHGTTSDIKYTHI